MRKIRWFLFPVLMVVAIIMTLNLTRMLPGTWQAALFLQGR